MKTTDTIGAFRKTSMNTTEEEENKFRPLGRALKRELTDFEFAFCYVNFRRT